MHASRLRALACPAALTVLLAAGLAPARAEARCHGASRAPGAESGTALRAAVICEINRERRGRGLRPVRAHAGLARMAQRYARSMVRGGFFSHTSPGGGTLHDRLRASGYESGRTTAGEALAWGQGRLATPGAIVRSWMASPPHRAILLGRNYRHVGIGVAIGSPYHRGMRRSATYAADFGATR